MDKVAALQHALAGAVARAVELGIRLHRESSPVHQFEERGDADGEAPLHFSMMVGEIASRHARALLQIHEDEHHREDLTPLLPSLLSPEWVDLYRN